MTDEKSRFNFQVEVAPKNGRPTREIKIGDGETVVVERVDPGSFGSIQRVASRIARAFGVDAEARDAFALWLCNRVQDGAAEADAEAERIARESIERERFSPSATARAEAERMLASPALLGEIAEAVAAAGIVGEKPLVALAYLVTVSRLMDRPLYLILQGPPSSGKSAILERVASLLPPDAVLSATDATANALYYMGDKSALRHKLLFLGERKRQAAPESIDATKALRELVESGRLCKLVPIKQGETLETVRLELDGAPAIFETASHGMIPHEDVTRAILAWANETAEQTARVIQTLAQQKATGVGGLTDERLEAVRSVQWLLEPAPVVAPFLPEVASRFPTGKPEARRAFARFVGVLEASAILHQRQRDRRNGAIVADEDDGKLAWRLLAPWLANRLVDAPRPAVLAVWKVIRELGNANTPELVAACGLTRQTVGKAVEFLERCGAVEAIDRGKGRSKQVTVKMPDWEPERIELFPEL
ncbi:MAG: hypothetical protein Kow0040_01920 [Thermogutta sp.]